VSVTILQCLAHKKRYKEKTGKDNKIDLIFNVLMIRSSGEQGEITHGSVSVEGV
jgi:hypothetical protein